MAGNSLSTAGGVVSSVSPILGAVPIVGSALSGIGTIVGGILQQKGAEEQARQAAKVRKDALATKTGAMRPEYLAKLKMDKGLALGKVAGYETSKNLLEEQTANSLRSIQDSSPNGAATVAAISAALQQKNANENQLSIRNEEFKNAANQTVSQDLQMLGDKGVALEDKRDQWKREGLTAASAFDNAATANKMNAANTIISGLSSTAAGIGKSVQNNAYMKQLSDIYGSGAVGKTDETTPTNSTVGGGSLMTSPTTGFAPDQQQKLSNILSSNQALTDDDTKFLTDMYKGLAVSGTQKDARTAALIQQILQANR